jgi:hypothetical protein
MKKVIKKVVAKAPVKKTVAKKPMMKYGGAKKPLRKAQDGKTVQQMTDAENLNRTLAQIPLGIYVGAFLLFLFTGMPFI